MQSTEQISQTVEPVDLKNLMRGLWQVKAFIISLTILCFLLSMVYTNKLPDTYMVTTKAALPSSDSKSNMGGLAALAGINLSNTSNNINLLDHIEIVVKNSYFMDKLLAKKWDIEGDSITLEEYWEVTPDTSIDNWQYKHKMILYGMLRSAKTGLLELESENGILTITSTSKIASLSYQFNCYLKTLILDYFENTYQTKGKQKSAFVKSRFDEIKNELGQAEERLVSFKKKNLQSNSPLIALEEARLKRAVELKQVMFVEYSKEYELAKIEETREKPVFEVIQEPELPIFKSGPNRFKIKLALTLFGMVFSAVIGLFYSWYKEDKL